MDHRIGATIQAVSSDGIRKYRVVRIDLRCNVWGREIDVEVAPEVFLGHTWDIYFPKFRELVGERAVGSLTGPE